MAFASTTQRQTRIAKSDMEASRLVFVFVKDAKPKRKVAVPVPDGYTWSEFVQQVKSKLRIVGVKEVFHAATGQKIVALDELQDIDELCVVEGLEPAAASESASRERAGSASTSMTETAQPLRQQSLKADRHKVLVSGGQSPTNVDDEGKYRGRSNPLKRLLQRMLPGMFGPTLPVTSRDVDGPDTSGARVSVRRRRLRGGVLNLRNVLLLLAIASCLATMLWFFFKMPKLAT